MISCKRRAAPSAGPLLACVFAEHPRVAVSLRTRSSPRDDRDRLDVAGRAREDTRVEDTVRVRCPYCREWVDLYVDPDTTGVLVEDCAVCCRPWAVTVERDAGRLRIQVSRAQ
jgi:hypothetical protein